MKSSVCNIRPPSAAIGRCRLAFIFAGCWLFTAKLAALTLPPGFTESVIAIGLSNLTCMEFAPDGRLFFCEQAGSVRVIKEGVLLPDPFLKVVVDSFSERGLVGIAFDPGFESNQFVYVNYTMRDTTIHNRVSRFTAEGDTAVPNSEHIVMDLDAQTNSLHIGGAIHFGGDGKLYIGVGENGVKSQAQGLSNRFGKMLRINADGSIPDDNPFLESAAGANRSIWALGLRNPFTFAFQPGTGRMYINDVGDGAEEINEGFAGANYGWPVCQGACVPTRGMYQDPIHAFRSGVIVGGTFYDPPHPQFPSRYRGSYFFNDWTTVRISQLEPANQNRVTPFASGFDSVVDLKTGPDGRLYCLERKSILGRILAIGWSPYLTATRHGSLLKITWEESEAAHQLEATSALQANTEWLRVTNAIQVVNGTNSVELTVEEPWRYYRLSR